MESRSEASRLPVELYRQIVNYIHDTKTLLSLSRTDQALALEAGRALYRTLRLYGHALSTAHVLHRLGTNQRMAGYVNSIYIDLRSRPAPASFGMLESLLKAALQTTANLTELTVLAEGQKFGAWIPNKPPFKLRVLSTNNNLEKGLIPFLSTQTDIFRAEFITVPQLQLTVPGTAIPNLRVLSSHMDVAVYFLPGRNVTNLHLTSINTYLSPDLTLSFPSVRRLQAPTIFHDRQRLGQLFPNIEFLQAQFSDPQELSAIVMTLPHIEHLHLNWAAGREVLADASSTVAAMLFIRHTSLTIVEIAHIETWRFERGTGGQGMNATRIEPLDRNAWCAGQF